MDTGGVVHVGNGPDQLREDPLHLLDGQRAMLEKVIVELIA